MKLTSVAVAAGLLCCLANAHATKDVNLGPYTLSYDETTVLGELAGWGGGGSLFSFAWAIPSSVQVASTGPLVTASFDLPSFTITANPGWTLSGDVKAFLGNLVFTEVGGATTGILAYADVAVDGGPASSWSGGVGWTASLAGPGYLQGYFGDTATVPVGHFTSLTVSNASIVLSATGGAFSSIVAQPQNRLEISLFAAAVPEPEGYAMLLAGLAVVGWVVRRRHR